MKGRTNSQIAGIKSEKLNISLTSNQENHSDLLGAIITISYPDSNDTQQYIWEGHEITINIPHYVKYSVEYPSIIGYAKPATYISTAIAGNVRTLLAEYKTELVKVTLSASNGASVDGQIITVSKKDVVHVVPDYAAIDNYGVAIMDIYGKFYKDKATWENAGKPTVNGIAVSDGTHRFCIANEYAGNKTWGAYNVNVSGVTSASAEEDAILDFNGVANTDAIVANVTSSDGNFTTAPWSAAGLCRQFEFPDGSKGYLGAAGEWNMVKSAISQINTLLSAVDASRITTTASSASIHWTSTKWIYGSSSAFILRFQYDDITSSYRSYTGAIRAFTTIEPRILLIDKPDTSKEYVVTNGSAFIKVPHGEGYTLSLNMMTGFITPEEKTFIAEQQSREVSLIYESYPLGVYYQGVSGKLYTTKSSMGGDTVNGLAIIAENCSFVMAATKDIVYKGYDLPWGHNNTLILGIKTTTDASVAKTDFNGKQNTDKIISQLAGIVVGDNDSLIGAPAAEYCRSITFPNGKKGYMGAAGEYNALIANKSAVFTLLGYLSNSISSILSSASINSSTQVDASRFWKQEVQSTGIYTDNKGVTANNTMILPLTEL